MVAARDYKAKHSRNPVKGIQLFYALQNGFLEISFWDNRDYKPFELEGDNCRLSKTLKRPHWQRHYDCSFDVTTETIQLNGKSIRTRPGKADTFTCINGENVTRAFGNMLKTLLIESMKDETFSRLPKARKITLAVQDDEDIVWWSKTI